MSKFLPIDLHSTIEALGGRHPATVLRSARAILTDPEQWTEKALARDVHGEPVRPNSPNAVCFCLEGAIALCSNLGGVLLPYFSNLLDEQVRLHPVTQTHSELLVVPLPKDEGDVDTDDMFNEPTYCASLFNDTFRHDIVLDLLDRAIIAAEQDIV